MQAYQTFLWPCRCWWCDCLSVQADIYPDLATERTRTHFTCVCGLDVWSDRELDREHDFRDHSARQGRGAVGDRRGEPGTGFCLQCGKALTGRQRKYCGDACRMRYARKARARARQSEQPEPQPEPPNKKSRK